MRTIRFMELCTLNTCLWETCRTSLTPVLKYIFWIFLNIPCYQIKGCGKNIFNYNGDCYTVSHCKSSALNLSYSPACFLCCRSCLSWVTIWHLSLLINLFLLPLLPTLTDIILMFKRHIKCMTWCNQTPLPILLEQLILGEYYGYLKKYMTRLTATLLELSFNLGYPTFE